MTGGFQTQTAPLPSSRDAARFVLHLFYGEKGKWQTREKRDRSAEIYRRYLAGEDSVELGQAFGLSDRRIRDIIEHERAKHSGKWPWESRIAYDAKGQVLPLAPFGC